MNEDDLKIARERIKHVVVLMLENRSFDHLLGFLQHPNPRFERLNEGGFPIPTGLTDPTEWGVNSNGRHVLQLDPPHSHASVTMQLGRRGPTGNPSMDGFVNAYYQKLDGRENVPIIHWIRLAMLAIPVALILGGLLNVAPLGQVPLLAMSAIAVTIALIFEPVRRVQKLVGFAVWKVWLYPIVAGYALVAGAWGGIARLVDDTGAGLVWWLIAFGVLVVVLLVARGKLGPKLHHVAADVNDPSSRLRIMKCMDPAAELPVLSRLATEYAICTRWFASVPGATWPNRNFLHAATSDRSVDIEPGFYESKTVFQLLDEAGVGTPDIPAWRVYHDHTPQLIAYPYVWNEAHLPRWHPMPDLAEHARADQLAPYSFIEPRHGGVGTNSQHPGNNQKNTPTADDTTSNDFRRSEQLVLDVYNALAPRLDDTLLVITYDEHGGFFDHVPPPKAPAPKPIEHLHSRVLTRSRLFIGWFLEHRNTPFHFRRYGVRVPSIVISNWITPGTVVDDVVFDHTSVAATLRLLFAPQADPLTRRDELANTFENLVLGSTAPRQPLTDLPDPAGDDGGPTDVASGVADGSAPAAGDATPAKPLTTRTSDGRQPARPDAMRVDADLEDQLDHLASMVHARLDGIEGQYGMGDREVAPPVLGERLHAAARAGRAAGPGQAVDDGS